jgi:hypothetical protein
LGCSTLKGANAITKTGENQLMTSVCVNFESNTAAADSEIEEVGD